MGSIDGDEGGNGGAGSGKDEMIYVSVRVRPLNSKEIERNDHSDWEIINNTTLIFKNSLPDRSMLPSAYTYDRVFGYNCDTRSVYEEGAKEIALSVVNGINSSIFAYGQTSSGKTYTMCGITEYFVDDIYEYIDQHGEREFLLKFSAIEIYNEAVRDLLSSDSTPLRLLDDPERGIVIEKLTEETLKDKSHLKELLAICEAQRRIGETLLNEASSRSHQILRLTIESSAREFRASSLSATVNFVDLAGSERASQTLSAGTRLKEGSHINRSLLTLGTIIRKLSKGRNGHVPYRDSKLTRILQNSLGGNARTAIICTMSPARSHIEQSRNTLLFASCAKEVATSARINVVMSDKSLVKHLRRELARLEDELRYVGLIHNTTHIDELQEKDAQITKMEKEIMELIQQRDVALSRLRNLLASVGDNQASRKLEELRRSTVLHACNPDDCHSSSHWEGSSQFSGQLVSNDQASSQWEESSQLSVYHAGTSDDESSMSEASGICYQSPEFAISKCRISDLNNISDANQQPSVITSVSENLADSIKHFPQRSYQAPEIASEENCKVVQCIEGSDLIQNKNDFNVSLDEDCKNLVFTTFHANLKADHEQRLTIESGFGLALKRQIREGEASEDLVKPDVAESSPLLPSFTASSLSTNCRKTPVSGSNCFGIRSLETDCMPTCSSVDFLSVPENPPTENFFLRRNAASEELSRCLKHSENSSGEMLKDHYLKIPDKFPRLQHTRGYEGQPRSRHSRTASEVTIPSISTFVEELKEMTQVQYKEQLANNQETNRTDNGNYKAEENRKDAGTDPLLSSSESPYQWPLAFEKLQWEMIELWDACKVSLIHRTYFFLLFKGEPTDSIYMEVERRRLSFLKKMLSQENEAETLSSIIRKLRRERDMLHKRMQKKLSAAEREDLYVKWGIELDSKNRRMQLAQRIWTDTKNFKHVKESALLVAKLVGLLEPEQALKEMFGLSFTPQRAHRRSSSWKHIPSLRGSQKVSNLFEL